MNKRCFSGVGLDFKTTVHNGQYKILINKLECYLVY